MFLFKKFVTQAFMPLPLSLGLCLIGLALLWFTRKEKTGKGLITAGFILLVLASYSSVPNGLTNSLERQTSPLVVQDQSLPKLIVILGSGNVSEPRGSGKTYLTPSSLFRVVEGVRLYRAITGARLLVCGGPTNGSVPEAETMTETAIDLGVPRADISLEPTSMDTEDQIARVKELVKGERFIVVSSALHLPRTLMLFKQVGLDPIPAPTDYRAGNEGPSRGTLFPQATNVRKLELSAKEYLGIMWYRLKGKQ